MLPVFVLFAICWIISGYYFIHAALVVNVAWICTLQRKKWKERRIWQIYHELLGPLSPNAREALEESTRKSFGHEGLGQS